MPLPGGPGVSPFVCVAGRTGSSGGGASTGGAGSSRLRPFGGSFPAFRSFATFRWGVGCKTEFLDVVLVEDFMNSVRIAFVLLYPVDKSGSHLLLDRRRHFANSRDFTRPKGITAVFEGRRINKALRSPVVECRYEMLRGS